VTSRRRILARALVCAAALLAAASVWPCRASAQQPPADAPIITSSQGLLTGPTVTGQVRFVTGEPLTQSIKVIVTPVNQTSPAQQVRGHTDGDGRFSVRIPSGPSWNRVDIHLRDAHVYQFGTLRDLDPLQPIKTTLDKLPQVAEHLPGFLDALSRAIETGIDPDGLAMAADAVQKAHASYFARDRIASARIEVMQTALANLQEMRLRENFASVGAIGGLYLAAIDPTRVSAGPARLSINGADTQADRMRSAAPWEDVQWSTSPGFGSGRWPPAPAHSFFGRTWLDQRVVPPLDAAPSTDRSNTRRGRFAFATSPRQLTSAPIARQCDCPSGSTAYAREAFHDVNTYAGAAAFDRQLSLFGAYAYSQDEDSQPGTDPASPARRWTHQIGERLTWRATDTVTIDQTYRDALWHATDIPTIAEPFATQATYTGRQPSVAVELRHVATGHTVWDVYGSFATSPDDRARPNSSAAPWRYDFDTGRTSGGSYGAGAFARQRTGVGGQLTHVSDRLSTFTMRADFERREERESWEYPGGAHLHDRAGAPALGYFRSASNIGAATNVLRVTANEHIKLDRLQIGVGAQYDRTEGQSPEIREMAPDGRETGRTIPGRGSLFVSHRVLPQAWLQVNALDKLLLYGRAVWLPEVVGLSRLAQVHPGNAALTIRAFDPVTQQYSRPVATIAPAINMRVDPGLRAPWSRQARAGARWAPKGLTAIDVEYLHVDMRGLQGWTDIAGDYALDQIILPDGRTIPALSLRSAPETRLFELGNPDDRFWRRDALAATFRTSWSGGYHMLASYVWSNTRGLTDESGAKIAPAALAYERAIRFGQDPNDVTNARGELPESRRHTLRLQGSVTVPGIDVRLDAQLYQTSGLTYASFANVPLPQDTVPIFVEPAGSRRLPAQTLLDLRVSRRFDLSSRARVDLTLEVLNLLNETSATQIVTGNTFSGNFASASRFQQPRRAMLGFNFSF
jgi:hypothetical protein